MMNCVRALVLFMGLVGLWACSNANNDAIILDANGKHPVGWVVQANGGNHPAAYLSLPDQCFACHGQDLLGGISKVSCFSAGRNGMNCHAQGPSGHPAGWSAPGAHGVSAKAAVIGNKGMLFCTNCHGADFRGNGTTLKDCLRCHTTAPHPPRPWMGSFTHTSTDAGNASACALCHTGRANLSAAGLANLPSTPIIGSGGCFNNTLCHGVMGHGGDPQPWSLPANHGTRAKADPVAGGNTGLAICQQCHGNGFDRALGSNSCVTCHGVAAPHPSAAQWRFVGTISHTTTGVNNAGVCAQCHNSTTKNLDQIYAARFAPAGSFSGGTPGCFNGALCHADITRTSNCTVCHGPLSTSSFNSLAGVTAPGDARVGAHVRHLNAVAGLPVACAACHTVPTSPATGGSHRNGTVDITFGTLAKTGGLNPTVTRDAATGALVCTNTYCHGASLNGGSNKSPRWNDTAYNAGCATCHGYPPTTIRGGATHPSNANCSSCHPHVSSNNTGFSDPARHIDGTVEALGGHSFPNPGSAHKGASNGTGCLSAGCHSLGSTASTYPVTTGTPPDCRGCHRNANPGTNPQCSDCHGDATTGRPNGSTFPNFAGRHANPGDHAVACDTCHSGGGTGTSTHGNSNRVAKTAGNVVLGASGAAAGMSITRSAGVVTCNGVCHSETHSNRTW